MELHWENINITATIGKGKNVQTKKILRDIRGMSVAGELTSIIGPSGCGKTTLLNFLSGRLFSQNLALSGQIRVNGEESNDMTKLGDKMAYVM